MTLPQLSPTFDRSQGIGASEVGAALGLSRFVSPYALWARKTGRTDDAEQTNAMEWGLRLQDPILSAYADRLAADPNTADHRVHANSTTKRLPTWQHLFATPDGFVMANRPAPQPGMRRAWVVDAKAPRSSDGWGPDGSSEVPPDYYAQAQAQCLVFDLLRCDLAVLFHGSDFRVYPIAANPHDQAAMLTALREWWEAHIVADQPPPIEAPPLDSTDTALARFHGGAGDLLAVPETEALVASLVLAWHNRKQASDAYDLTRQQVEAILGDHDRLATGAGIVTWARMRDADLTNWQALAEAFRKVITAMQASTGFNLADPDVDLGGLGVDLSGYPSLDQFLDTLTGLYTSTRPGARRFIVKPVSTED